LAHVDADADGCGNTHPNLDPAPDRRGHGSANDRADPDAHRDTGRDPSADRTTHPWRDGNAVHRPYEQ
jgi:hypothetical protein